MTSPFNGIDKLIWDELLIPPPALGCPSFGKVATVTPTTGLEFLMLDFRLPSGVSEYTFSCFVRACYEGVITGLPPSMCTFYTWDTCKGTLVGAQIFEPDILPLDSSGAWVSGPILTIPAKLDEGDGWGLTRFATLGLWAVHLNCSAPVVFTIAGNTIELPAGGHKFTIDGKENVPHISVQSNPDAIIKLAVWIAKPNKYYGRNDVNVANPGNFSWNDRNGLITNIFKHFSVRVKLDQAQKKHLYTTTFDNVDKSESLPRVIDEFEYPPRNDMTMGNQTMFRFMTFRNQVGHLPTQFFDFRFYPLWLGDDCVELLRTGGFRSLVSRNIPLQWSPPL